MTEHDLLAILPSDDDDDAFEPIPAVDHAVTDETGIFFI